MKKLKLIIPIVIFLVSCGKNKLPEGILDEDKMVSVLIDIHIAEGLVSTLPINYDSSRTMYPMFENEVFRKHNVADSVFHRSLEYYLANPRIIDRIYARTIDSLNVIEKSGNTKETDDLPQ
ncbi:hypothetical protein Belba_3723 [Belliella baltica DSM 15883]|uniref:DUF4296 domain-containing protein n=1 Tax=Belliella baltica (strain DSM 15883 / CIP 108006 / LMG 21964 / BA134) TaxID=866536 RepID=I3ZAE3_BELBD|nr:DUF4296 domain-containing protein [Belliella baltica]AFL86211.1 hypothetical protein Belba_3723 [Belliella baltica DSM 15883]